MCVTFYLLSFDSRGIGELTDLLACVGTNLAHTELRLGAANFFRKFPKARVSTKEGMNDDDMRQRAWVFTSPVGHRCLIDP